MRACDCVRGTWGLVMLLAFVVSCDDGDHEVEPLVEPPELRGPMLPSVFLVRASDEPMARSARAFADSLLRLANWQLAEGRPFFDLLPTGWEHDGSGRWRQSCAGATCLGTYTAAASDDGWTWTYATEDTCTAARQCPWTAYEAEASNDNRSGRLLIFAPFETEPSSEWTWNQATPSGLW